MGKIPIYKIEGTPLERGQQHGSYCRDKIKEIIIVYKSWFKEFVKIEWETAQSDAQAYADAIQDYDRDIFDEIQGIARGANVDFLDIIVLNARSEIASTFLSKKQGKAIPPEGCTAIALDMAYVNGSEEVFLGQNWDWIPHTDNCLAIFKIIQPERPSVITMTEAGIVGKVGVNSAGVALCLNFLSSNINKIGVPCHILCRSALNSWNLGKAIWEVARADRAGSANFLLGHSGGEVLSLEFTAEDFDVIYPANGILAHTNHFLNDFQIVDKTKTLFPDTLLRQNRASKLLGFHQNKGIGALQNVLRDHFNFPEAICKHQDVRAPEWLRAQTNFSFVLDMNKNVMHFTEGNPCGQDYKRLSYIEL